jgi:hypothetical protein
MNVIKLKILNDIAIIYEMISEISTNDIIFIFGEFKNKIYIKNFEK